MNIFLTFANTPLRKSLTRIARQASDLEYFDKIHACDETSLDTSFRRQFKKSLMHGSRGYGYWCWKSQLLLQALERANEGDVVHYSDVGCHLNKNGLWRLSEYFEMTRQCPSGIMAFQPMMPARTSPFYGIDNVDYPDYQWTKGDLFDYFGVRNNQNFTHTQSFWAGTIFVRKCDEALRLINEWQSVIAKDFTLIDDTPSRSSNFIGFKEHRHDQSIFSILCKKYCVGALPLYETWYSREGEEAHDWSLLKNYPLQARRDKDSGVLGKSYILTGRTWLRTTRMISLILNRR